MKKLIPFFTLLFSTLWLSAQITVTDATFPATGDTLKTSLDLTPSGIEITPAGANFEWDYTSLSEDVENRTVYLDASAGTAAAEVPFATHVSIDPTTAAETYFRVTNEAVLFIAANGEDPVGAGIDALFRFDPPIVQRRAPLSFPANDESESNLNIAFAWEDLPAFITDSIPVIIVPDSVRIRINQIQEDFVDAFGTLRIPGGEYEVLREKRTIERDTRLEVLVEIPFLGFQWQDVTDLLGGGGLFEGLGQDTTVAYNFYSNDAKETIVTATMNDDESAVQQVAFKDNDFVSSIREVELLPVSISPNPATDWLHMELGDFPEGELQLKVFALSGNIFVDKKIYATKGHVEILELSGLPNGTLIFQLTDLSGRLFASGKFVKE